MPGRAPGAPRERLATIDLAGLALAAGGAVLAFIASFLPWISADSEFLDQNRSYWQLAEASDIFLTLFAAATIAAAASCFVWPQLRLVRLLTLAMVGALLSFTLLDPIEFMASGEEGVSTTQAGEILALLAAAALLAAVAVQVIEIGSSLGLDAHRDALLTLGLGMLCVAAAAEPLVALLPLESGTSAWESSEVSDILGTVVDAAIVAVALAALLLRDGRALVASVALGAYLAAGSLVGAIEGLAQEQDGAAVFVWLLVLAPLATVGTVLIVLGSGLLRGGLPVSQRPAGWPPA